jgi:hypothetical protein
VSSKIADLRAKYKAFREKAAGPIWRWTAGDGRREVWHTGVSPEEWDKFILGAFQDLGTKPADATPDQWVEAAKIAETRARFCFRCGGTGAFITAIVNGKPTGPGGRCFRCDGKGWQTDDDRLRNAKYDVFGIKLSAG